MCTNSGTVAFMGNPPSGPLGGTTSLTNINTATGVAGGIQTTANRGDATTVNYGTVNGNVGANTGDFGQDALRNATVYNYGTVNGIIRAITYFSGGRHDHQYRSCDGAGRECQREWFRFRQNLQQRDGTQYQRIGGIDVSSVKPWSSIPAPWQD